jgi:hypothetical protein
MQINKQESKLLFEVAVIEFVRRLSLIEKLLFFQLFNGASIRQAARRIGYSHVAALKHVKEIRKKYGMFFDVPKGIL